MKNFVIYFILLVFMSSCSGQPKQDGYSVTSASNGLMTNASLNFPVYITQSIDISSEKNSDKIPQDALIIHQGHFLNPKNTKMDNENVLKNLENNNFHLVNLTLDDLAIAINQDIKLSSFKKLYFLNSTIEDVQNDKIYDEENVLPYYIHNDVIFIGLSEKSVYDKLNTDRFLINDYIFSILKIKKETISKNPKSYILIHHLEKIEMNEIMERLPPSFINSLAY